MTSEMVHNLCVAGIAVYLDFLVENELGIEKTCVIRKERIGGHDRQVFVLALERRLFDPDCVFLEMQPPRQTFGPGDFKVIEYDNDAKTLIVEVQNPILALDAIPAENLRVISDFRFLVKNVKRWFEANGNTLQLPNLNHDFGATAFDERGSSLLQCQKEAVSASLSNPMTYIWGPPGTGKTRHVLTEAVLLLLLAEKRIGIFAPTNNALEQAMEAILQASEAEGINRGKFLRVGHLSAGFATSFPEVCEDQDLQRRVSRIKGQIRIYETVLNHRRGATVLNSVATLRHEIGQLQDLLRDRRRIYEELAQIRSGSLSRVVHFFDGKTRSLNDELALLEPKINGRLEMIRRIQTESSKLNEIVERIDFTNVEHIEENMTDLENDILQYMEVKQALADEYEGQPNEEIQRLITNFNEQLEDLIAQTSMERIKLSSVIGMTLDCFIGRFYDTLLPFDHIFVDEAGYAPLVKAATLCRGGIPITFIGDHKQLGPVCEMNDKDVVATRRNRTAILWKKSALFVDELFLRDNQDAIISQLFELAEPELKSFTFAKLNTTFRFGQNLADILSECVYQGFRLLSASTQGNLRITRLDAVLNQEPARKRQNIAEVQRIVSYLQDHPELEDGTEADFVILTPYKKQVTLLGQHLVGARRLDRITNVHKSQGREWDTVILSVVDALSNRNKPWFTDTNNQKSGGLHVMNTAISRAKKHLILVCDGESWIRLPDSEQQLISRLLQATGC